MAVQDDGRSLQFGGLRGLVVLAWPASPSRRSPRELARRSAMPRGCPSVARQVERHSITWHFDREHVVGAFANGDPWVLGPVSIESIDPASVRVRHTDGWHRALRSSSSPGRGFAALAVHVHE